MGSGCLQMNKSNYTILICAKKLNKLDYDIILGDKSYFTFPGFHKAPTKVESSNTTLLISVPHKWYDTATAIIVGRTLYVDQY